MSTITMREHTFTEDELVDAYGDGYTHGASDHIRHRGYDRGLSDSIQDTWDAKYADGYDSGFREQSEQPDTGGINYG